MTHSIRWCPFVEVGFARSRASIRASVLQLMGAAASVSKCLLNEPEWGWIYDHHWSPIWYVDASENDEDVGLAGLTPQEIGSLRGKMMIQPCMYVYIYIYKPLDLPGALFSKQSHRDQHLWGTKHQGHQGLGCFPSERILVPQNTVKDPISQTHNDLFLLPRASNCVSDPTTCCLFCWHPQFRPRRTCSIRSGFHTHLGCLAWCRSKH